jgi:hypothetical protein
MALSLSTSRKDKTLKNKCVKNATTKRCRKSENTDNTSDQCKLFDKTKRCRKFKGDAQTKVNAPTKVKAQTKVKAPKKRKTIKNRCIKNATTKRCRKSEKSDDTSDQCKIFQKTQRCRSLKDEKFEMYKNFKVKKNVKSFLQQKIINVPLPKLIEKAKSHLDEDDYEDIMEVILENKKKTEAQIKSGFEEEILDLAHHSVRDATGSEVITLQSIKHALKENQFDFL